MDGTAEQSRVAVTQIDAVSARGADGADGAGSRTRWRPRPPTRATLLAAVMSTLIAVDQATKWWAWRDHQSTAFVNNGGNFLIGPKMSSWLTYGASGAVLDFAAVLVLTLCAVTLAQHGRSRGVLVAGGLFLSGWMSNLLDRLGLHQVTAPGSSRGVVDFILVGPQTFNLADIAIAVGGTGLVLAVARAIIGTGRAPLIDEVLVPARMR